MSEPIRRLELFTGAGGRRSWSESEKAAIVAESECQGASVSAVARRHGLSASQLFTWRRLARQAVTGDPGAALHFVPAVLEAGPPEPTCGAVATRSRRRADRAGIEIAMAGATIRVDPDARAAQIAAVIRALKATQ